MCSENSNSAQSKISETIITAFYEPTLMDFVSQTVDQECRVQVPPNVTDRWSIGFNTFRQELSKFLVTVYPESFWRALVKRCGFDAETSPDCRDFLCSCVHIAVSEYVRELWKRISANLSDGPVTKTINTLLDQSKQEEYMIAARLPFANLPVQLCDWEQFVTYSHFNVMGIIGDIQNII